MKEHSIIILSGLSGSGKSTALRTLEDLGFFCIDNLPIQLLPVFVELCQSSSEDISRIALVVDARSRVFLNSFQATMREMQDKGYDIKLIFLDCSDDALIKRFSETRRQHPFADGGAVYDGISVERELLDEIKRDADTVFDTSDLNVHQLRTVFEEYFKDSAKREMAITFMSFGYKYGVPHNVDIVLDVRFLPNPFFVDHLKNLTGNDQPVVDYIFEAQETKTYLQLTEEYLSYQIPLFEREGKSYLTIAVGCTGGRHRSVAVAAYLKKLFSRGRNRVYLRNREI